LVNTASGTHWQPGGKGKSTFSPHFITAVEVQVQEAGENDNDYQIFYFMYP
jgi:hypothetical protein